MIAFTVYGVAQAKGSMRAFQPRGMRAPIITDGNRNVKGWQALVAAEASAALAQLPDADRRLLGGAVQCEIGYFLPRPKALCIPKYHGVDVPHTKRPDVDKLTRAVLDALTGVLWTDDAQVVALRARKRYADVGKTPRIDVVVTVAQLADDLARFLDAHTEA